MYGIIAHFFFFFFNSVIGRASVSSSTEFLQGKRLPPIILRVFLLSMIQGRQPKCEKLKWKFLEIMVSKNLLLSFFMK